MFRSLFLPCHAMDSAHQQQSIATQTFQIGQGCMWGRSKLGPEPIWPEFIIFAQYGIWNREVVRNTPWRVSVLTASCADTGHTTPQQPCSPAPVTTARRRGAHAVITCTQVTPSARSQSTPLYNISVSGTQALTHHPFPSIHCRQQQLPGTPELGLLQLNSRL